jgi:hypothetical protein
MLDALRAIISPQRNAGGEQDVVALYVEGGPAELASAASIANTAGLVMALTAPDSLIAVAPKRIVNVSSLATKLGELGAKVALGATTATITGSVVDGPALDVEGWAPYPLETGLWIAPELK